MKKLMILGGNPETGVLVEIANAMKIYTIVVDPNPNAPAKKNAKEIYDIDGFAVNEIAKLALKLKVDGILVGVADILVKPYKDICNILGLHCYATDEAIEAFCSKDGFKRYCEEYGIQDIPGIYLDKNSPIVKPENIDYPLMIKPVDSGGGVGMRICRDNLDYTEAVRTALSFSKRGVVLVEKYMECEDMAAYYTFKDGIPYLSATYDRITTKKQGDASPVCIGAVYPSKHIANFKKKIDPILSDFFKGLNLKNGVLNLQFFVDGDKFYAYDPGFRLQGEAPHIHLLHINKFDHRKMLINFALTGIFGDSDFHKKNDPSFKGLKACTVWVLLRDGKIQVIDGVEKLKSSLDIVFFQDRFKVGDVVSKEMLGTERQVFARIYLCGNSIQELDQKINKIKNNLTIQDENGNDMILYWMNPNKSKS